MDTIDASMESMLEMFIFETTGLLEQLDEIMLSSEKDGGFSEDNINEIFRIMHTVKGSAAMMGLETLSSVAHKVEDMFFIIREDPSIINQHSSSLFDILFKSSDFMRGELDKIQSGDYQSANADELIGQITKQKAILSGEAVDENATQHEDEKQENAQNANYYQVRVFFEDGCQMENIRAVMLINNITDWCDEIHFSPEDVETNSATCKDIIEHGFDIFFTPAKTANDVYKAIETSINVKSYESIYEPTEKEENQENDLVSSLLGEIDALAENSGASVEEGQNVEIKTEVENKTEKINKEISSARPAKQNLISVNLTKLDQLMDIVGEIVITESMVASSPDLKGLVLDNFNKATRQLRKLTDTLQDTVMSIRMVEIAGVLQKMNRLVRDMN
ncbi:MAG: Hpt domain-containing protein, partial [Oscillospiraceae bacterium]